MVRLAPLCLALVACAAVSLQAQHPLLADVLGRAAAYVDGYSQELSGIVVEESYVQDVRVPLARVNMRRGGGFPSGPQHRTLKSDLLVVRPSGADRWIQFRDVFEVDGRTLRDRNNRLARLFLEPSSSTATLAEQLTTESARYNIGDIVRTVNVPQLALLVLDRDNQARFQFGRDTHAKSRPGPHDTVIPSDVPRSELFVVPAETTMISFDEVHEHTLVRTGGDRDLPIHGRFWLFEDDGEVAMTELIAEDWTLSARIHVVYAHQPGLSLPVPIEMHEVYERRADGQHIEGTATYSNFRQFTVQVDEQIAPIK